MIIPIKMGQRVAAHLRDQIIAGELQAGTPLRIHELARRFGVSTTPVREALVTLEREGLAQGRPHHGLRVIQFTRDDIEDVYAVHAYMVRLATERAATALTEAELEALGDINREIARVTADGELALAAELNHKFHRTINRAGSSQMMRRFLAETTPYVTRRTNPLVPGWAGLPLQEHGPILAALHDRDSERAGLLMEQHVRHSGELVVALGQVGIDVDDSPRAAIS